MRVNDSTINLCVRRRRSLLARCKERATGEVVFRRKSLSSHASSDDEVAIGGGFGSPFVGQHEVPTTGAPI